MVAGVNIQEDDPEDTSVGYGGLPNELGIVGARRLRDAAPEARVRLCRLHTQYQEPIESRQARHGAGRTTSCWSVREHQVSRRHGASRRRNSFTEKSRLAWIVWKQSLQDEPSQDNWTDGLDAGKRSREAGSPQSSTAPVSERRPIERSRGPARCRAFLRQEPSIASRLTARERCRLHDGRRAGLEGGGRVGALRSSEPAYMWMRTSGAQARPVAVRRTFVSPGRTAS